MAGKIPQQFIDDLLARVDIVDLVDARVPLKKAGHEYKACCPFHNEKTPSFTVSPNKQFYHCFGCGAHGTAIGFLMEYDRLEFTEAIEALAEGLGLEVPREGGSSAPRRNLDRHYELLEEATRFYAWQLRHHAEAQRAIDYLRQRGVSGEIARHFRIGFAPPGYDNLKQALAGHDGLAEAGLVQQKDGSSYDRFRDRIMFPIQDARGRVVGFGGRTMGDSGPKYLNSPETPVFHKGRELYGLHQARRSNGSNERLLVVEGYMDVIALVQAGITNAVATLGTATTTEHVDKLFRATREIVFCFDGDRAGREAAWRALEACLPQMRDGREARFLFLPEGEDPDSQVRQEGAEQFLERIGRQAMPLADLLIERLRINAGDSGIAGRARLAEMARPYLDKLPGGGYRELIGQAIEDYSGLQLIKGRAETATGRAGQGSVRLATLPLIRRAVALLLQAPGLARLEGLSSEWRSWQGPGVEFLQDLFDRSATEQDLSTAVLVERAHNPELRKTLAQLATEDLGAEGDFESQFRGCLQTLGQRARAQRLEFLTRKGPPSSLTEKEKQELRELYRSSDTPLD